MIPNTAPLLSLQDFAYRMFFSVEGLFQGEEKLQTFEKVLQKHAKWHYSSLSFIQAHCAREISNRHIPAPSNTGPWRCCTWAKNLAQCAHDPVGYFGRCTRFRYKTSVYSILCSNLHRLRSPTTWFRLRQSTIHPLTH